MNDLVAERRKKLEALKKAGIDPFPARSGRTHLAADALKETLGKTVTIAGRIRALRAHGGSSFADVQDASGTIQVLFKKDVLSRRYDLLEQLDIGDFVEVGGTLFETSTKQKTIEAHELKILTKTLHPLPEKRAGLKDHEERHRKRYLDLLTNPESRRVFEIRSKIISAMRRFLEREGYLEVETPILQPIYGGTLAQPFKTHHNELHQDLYLRISNELYLKRLVVGGFEKVFEIGRDFRNEGVSTRHNPEFTFMETMRAYADYRDNMAFCEEMTKFIAQEVLGTLAIEYQGKKIDLGAWQKIEHPGSEEAFKRQEPEWIQPTIVYDFPLEGSPLAKQSAENSKRAERFEVFIGGLELMNTYSELNDPDELKKHFAEQAALRKQGDLEAHPTDDDFVEALTYGMPPTSGVGVGIDRLVMLLCDSPSIRDVILFPALRERK